MGNPGGRPNRRQDNQFSFPRRAGIYLAVAFELPSMILGGLLVGYLLDDYLGTSPWFLIAITAIAFTGAFVRLVQWMRFFSKERNDKGGTNDDPAH